MNHMTRASWHRITGTTTILWMLAAAAAITAHRFIPEAKWLMIHTATLGIITNALLTWTNHFTTSILRSRPQTSRRAEGTILATLNAGILTLGTGMILAHPWITGVGATLIAIAVTAHIARLAHQMRAALPARFRFTVRAYIAAGILFIPGILAGYLLTLPSIPANYSAALRGSHIAFNVLGWVGLPIIGTLLTLWPTILRTRMPETAEIAARKYLPWLTASAAFAALGALALPLLENTALPSAILMGAGMIAFTTFAALIVVPLVRDSGIDTTFPSLSVAAGTVWLLGSITAAGIALLLGDGIDTLNNLTPYTIPLLAGGIAQIVLGALAYLLPVVAGGGPTAVRVRNIRANSAGVLRIALLNLSLALYVVSNVSLILVATSLLALLAGLASVVALIASMLPVSDAQLERAPGPDVRRDGTRAPKPDLLKPAMVALTMLSMVVVGATALDPAAAAGLNATAPSSETSADATGETTEISVEIRNMRYIPELVEVPAGNRLIINLHNDDDQTHDLVLETGVSTKRMGPDETVTLDAGIITTDVEGWCSIAGHRQMGMVFHIKVLGADTASAAGDTGDQAGSEGMEGEASDSSGHDMHDMHAMHSMPAEAAFDLAGDMDPARYRDPSLPPLPPADGPVTHELTFEVTEEVIEVAPGLTQNIWLFNGQMPGPTLHGRVGDTFIITLINKGTMGHSIDFHAGALAPDEPMRTIQPGESLEYKFTAERSGIWMYHCSTAPMSLHIANGMYGAVVIEPPNLEPVDHSFVLVQGESYYGPDGEIGDMNKIAEGDHDTTHFNGYPHQYVKNPLTVAAGERVRFWVLDAGVAVPLSFHIVGGQFDTVFKEGAYLLRPDNELAGGSQALGLMAAEGGFVELVFPEPGTYTFVNHVMIEAERGAKGHVIVTE
ncbi:MAG: multicopper oxidase domain-containing protein [Actinomycetaceae bacterium]|nr:multicopper oxidase domain-containing protein [Actinomycetaceae bacterium]